MSPLPALPLKTWAALGTGALILGLVAALLITRATLDDVKHERDAAEMKLSVSNASIERLSSSLSAVREQQAELANADANRIEASRQALEMAEAASKVRQAAIDRLLASAEVIRDPANDNQCEVSEAVEAVWPS